MEISSIQGSPVLDIMAQATKVQSDQATKLAKINIEQQMEAEKMELAQKALVDIFA